MDNLNDKVHENLTFEVTDDEIDYDSQYSVVLHNDDITPIEFVIVVLMQIFKKELHQSMELAIEANDSGSAVIETTTKERAYKLIDEFVSFQKATPFDLKITAEEV